MVPILITAQTENAISNPSPKFLLRKKPAGVEL